MKLKNLFVITAAALAAAPALADINVGVVASLTGPAAALGAETRKAVSLFPASVGGEKVNFILLDDATDPTAAVKNVRKLISEDKVDAILGPNLISTAVAMADVANGEKVPMVSVAPLDVAGDKRHFVFRSEPSADLMVQRVVADMVAAGVKTVGFIGFSDAYGEGWYQEFTKAAKAKNLSIVANERYARTDTSVTGQTLKIMAAKPDAVLVGGSGTPAALPQKTLKERGYTGKYYQTHGVANADFLRVGGKDVEGTLLPAGPVLVADQLPADNPVRKAAQEYIKAYEGAYGKGSVSTFGGHAWDAGQILKAAIPVALKSGQPGTPQFRAALRDAMEGVKEVAGAHGIFNMSANDHLGLDQRARVMVTIQNGQWKYLGAK